MEESEAMAVATLPLPEAVAVVLAVQVVKTVLAARSM